MSQDRNWRRMTGPNSFEGGGGGRRQGEAGGLELEGSRGGRTRGLEPAQELAPPPLSSCQHEAQLPSSATMSIFAGPRRVICQLFPALPLPTLCPRVFSPICSPPPAFVLQPESSASPHVMSTATVLRTQPITITLLSPYLMATSVAVHTEPSTISRQCRMHSALNVALNTPGSFGSAGRGP